MNYRSILCFIFTLLLLVSCEQAPVYKRYQSVYKLGDEPAWASQEWNDQDWEQYIALVPNGQVFWNRTRIDILKRPEPLHPYGLQLEVYGEYEVFWDGVLIGKNGNPGQEAALPPEGKLWVTYSIPTHLTAPGEHVLAIRSSLYYFPDHVGIFDLDIDYYDALLTEQLIETSYLHIFAGIFLIASCYYLFLFLSDRKAYPMLVFSICCFLFFSLTMTHFVRITVPIHYSLHVVRFEIISLLMFGISFLIPLYFSLQFPFPRRNVFLGTHAGVLLFLYFYKHHIFHFISYNMALSMWAFCFGIALYAVSQKAKGARLVLMALLLCILLRYITSFSVSLFIGFSLILLSMFYILSLRMKAQQLAYKNSLVESTRLRLELLKKNIQPHFLMNTLTSLIDWVEEEPKKGVLFIEALAKEFDILNQIESQALIPITQEIALCRTHLEIMTYRKEVNYSLEESGIDASQKIPPAILHTLLENGITHSLPLEDNSIRFQLIYEASHDEICYTFLTFGRRVRHEAKAKEGTGLSYIKARLTESYQSNWSLASEPTDHGWKNIIKIYS